MNVRAKFRVDSVVSYEGEAKTVNLRAINDNSTEENRRFTKYTPYGKAEVTIDNPAIIGEFWPGREFYLDFVPVPEEVPAS